MLNLSKLSTSSGVLRRLARGKTTSVDHIIKLVESHKGLIMPSVRKVLTPAYIRKWHANRGKSTLKWDKSAKPKAIGDLQRPANVIRRVYKKGMSILDLERAVRQAPTKLKITKEDIQKWYHRKNPQPSGSILQKSEPFYQRIAVTTGKVDNRVLKRNDKWDKMLTKSWDDGYNWGIRRMYWHLREKHPKDHPTRLYIQRWLQTREAYSRHQPSKPKGKTIFKRPPTGVSHVWGIDLKDMLNDQFKDYKYILGCIDLFSRKMWALPLKNKESQTVADAFEKILKSLPKARRPKAIRSDVSPFPDIDNSGIFIFFFVTVGRFRIHLWAVEKGIGKIQ